MGCTELLIQYGFVKSQYKHLYKGKSPEEIKKILSSKDISDYKDHASEEVMEKSMHQYVKTGYPMPGSNYQDSFNHRRRFVFESYSMPIEETYFWILAHFTEGMNGYPIAEKIIDVFTSSEQSAFWGQSSTRLGVQQDKVSQYLATIGKMIKDLFQLVREIRILDERLGYYDDSTNQESKSRESAEITLKGIYVDMAEGGSKNPSSVFGMAAQLQFTTLPDLFFSVHPPTPEDVDAYVDKLEFNDAVKRVLKRKLRSYMEWKVHTHKEIRTRKIFTLKYMRQHYDVIHMYLQWIRPYLRNIARLQSESMEEKKLTTADLVTAFEGSLLEVEFMLRRMPEKNTKYFSVIICNFVLRTRPEMSFHQEGYRHQGPVHMGRVECIMRNYAWTEKDVEAYKNLRNAEDFEMIGKIDLSVREAMEGLGEELQKYLEEAGEEILLKRKSGESEEEKKKNTILKSTLGTFIRIPEKKSSSKPKKKKEDAMKMKSEKSKALKEGQKSMWTTYKNYKKAHGFLAW
jgi:hypothetical protein